ncbi:MAG: membrane protein insertase YidC, partial [Candidatus Zixiibacteriota bacterium]
MNNEPRPMDMKAILAFVILIVLILLIPNYWDWIGYKRPEPAQPVTADSTQAGDTTALPARQAATSPATLDTAGTAMVAADGFAADSLWRQETVTVETEFYQMALSTRGARITRLVLKDYQYTDPQRRGENIVLLDSTDQAGLEFRMYDPALDLAAAPFRVDKTSAVVQGGDSSIVRFTTRTQSGAPIEVVYTFHGARHDFGYRLIVPQPQEAGV